MPYRIPIKLHPRRSGVTLMGGVGRSILGLLLAMGVSAVPSLTAQESGAPPAPEERQGRITGAVTDARTGGVVVGAHVRIRELGRSDFSHRDGGYHFEDVPVGSYTLVVERLGYASREAVAEVREGEVTRVDLVLTPSAIAMSGLVVTGVGRARGVAEAYRPTSVLSGQELERRLSWSLAESLAHEPGIAFRSFGPVTSQPVIRGLSGDRVLVLEDGQRTGDLSTTAPDHAVGIDPVTAQRVEVVRGPAGLLYGNNALGGVINVIREEVPRGQPDAMHGVLSAQGESVHQGGTLSGAVEFPLGSVWAGRAEVSGRRGGDVRTPRGELPGTDSRGINAAVGLSRIPSWGYVGGSYRIYGLHHGVPGEFDGELIPGAHPSGADLETLRQVGRFQLGHFSGLGPFSSVEVEANAIRYAHDEIEGTLESGDRVLGTSFRQWTATLGGMARHDHAPGLSVQEGAVGFFSMFRDLSTGGAFPGTRSAREWNVAAFVYEEFGRGRYRVQVGARYDRVHLSPRDRRPISTDTGPVPVRNRSFGDVSASMAGLVELPGGTIAGVSLARAFRTPSIQELYSDGPHLADFSYDIGNPELDPEVGLGADLFLRWVRDDVNAEVAVFRNAVSNFIHYRPTGGIDPRFFRFPLFVAAGADALFLGGEAKIQWEAMPGWVVDGNLSHVRAEYRESGEPLPAIPPMSGGVRLRHQGSSYFTTVGFQSTGAQTRVPFAVENPTPGGETIFPESPTDGHNLLHLGAGYHWTRGDRLHSITLNIENVFDTEWRDHLSRAREVAPQPGRNVQFLYRIAF